MRRVVDIKEVLLFPAMKPELVTGASSGAGASTSGGHA
jgi:hypothetical protein